MTTKIQPPTGDAPPTVGPPGAGVSVLVADDDAVARRMLSRHLEKAGFQVTVAADGDELIAKLDADRTDVQVALVDLQMPRHSGMECLRHITRHHPDVQAVMMSQYGQIRDAVEAMKQGAFEYITKPVDPEELVARVQQAARAAQLARENRVLRHAVGLPALAADFIGRSPALQTVLKQADRVADLDETVLVTGESGTGKTTLARLMHQAGARAPHPFVSVSCASLPRDLVEAELFGHVRGAYTGAVADRPGRAEMADGGTLFLDEVGDLPLELQPKLLTFLQDRVVRRIGENRDRPVDVRIIAATNKNLETMCRERTFREDLFFRLAVLPIDMPPLRDHLDDVLPLAEHSLERIGRQRQTAPPRLTDDAKRALVEYSWPGNVRELQNTLQRASAFCQGGVVDRADLSLRGGAAAVVPAVPAAPASLAGRTLAELERQAIVDTLAACNGNKKAAARKLGIDEKS
ncbi:MAG: sigma-54-dependent transcriptional regulator, partial [Planctomycetia bacterium]